MGILLFIISIIIYLPLTVVNVIYVLIKFTKKRGFFRVINKYFLDFAIDVDKVGGYQFRTLFNATLVKGYQFGMDRDETISSVLGKNQRDNTLTKVGTILANILDYLDEDHCKNSIKE